MKRDPAYRPLEEGSMESYTSDCAFTWTSAQEKMSPGVV